MTHQLLVAPRPSEAPRRPAGGAHRPSRRSRGRVRLGTLVGAGLATALLTASVLSGAPEDVVPTSAGGAVSEAPTASAPRTKERRVPPPVTPRAEGAPRPAPVPSGSGSADAPQPPAPAPAPPAPAAAEAPTEARPATTHAGPSCDGSGRTVVRPVRAGTTLAEQWEAASTPDDVTYDLTGVTSTAYPATNSVFAAGTRAPGQRTCVVGGTIRGAAEDAKTWEYYHDEYNAACVKIIASGWMQVRDVRCDNVEDGIKPQESGVNANNAQFFVSGTYLSRIRDDCMENDYTVGGVLHDNLWEQCNTGISERPSSDRSWPTPAAETLTLDRMLIGIYQTPHVEDGETVIGGNAVFKWSESGNRVVIKCSVFKVEAVSLNGTDTMAMPPGTVVDDSECPENPSTIVWLGGGDYPAWTAGMRVTDDPSVWTTAVRTWKAAHGY